MLHRPGPCTGEKKGSHGNALVFTKVQECANFLSCLEMLPRAGKVETGVRACIWGAACEFWVAVHTWPCPEESGSAFCSFDWVATEIQLPLWPNLHLCKTALDSGIPRKQAYPIHPVLQLHLWLIYHLPHCIHLDISCWGFFFLCSLYRNYWNSHQNQL